MADDIGKIRGGGASGVDLLKDVLGIKSRDGGADGVGGASSSAGKASVGPRGGRMLRPDVDVEKLDRDVPRGTYLDILV